MEPNTNQENTDPKQPTGQNFDSADQAIQPAPGSYGLTDNSSQPSAQSPANQQAYPQPPLPAPAVTNNPGLIVLQWLTYAFWGWTILALSILTGSILATFIGDAETGSFTPYAIAAVLVLLPISIACDFFYSKHEPQKKTGAASIVMVIHAVIFALFGIGALIGIVFSLVTMFTSSTDSITNKVSLFSAMIITVLYGAVFLRTINPARLPFVRRFYILFMTIVVGIICILGVVGPVARERTTRTDRLITSNLSSVELAIDDYAAENDRLPDTLASLDLKGDAKQLVAKDLVKYKPNTLPSSNTDDEYATDTAGLPRTTHYYQLCVTYTRESKNKYNSSYADKGDANGYTTSPDIYGGHEAGEKCYKLKTYTSNY